MSFVPNFSTSQNAGALSSLVITDTSTGSDPTITGRLVYIRKYDGNYLTPDGYTTSFVYWPVGSTSLTIEDILDQDYALDISVYWFVGSTSQYSKTILCLFTGYGDLFLRQLTQALAGNRIQSQQQNFWNNKNKLRVLLDDAAQAVSLLNDQTIATFCLDESRKLTANISSFF